MTLTEYLEAEVTRLSKEYWEAKHEGRPTDLSFIQGFHHAIAMVEEYELKEESE